LARNTFATIDVDAVAHNLAVVRARVGSARIMAVVKADAYGHGLRRCLPALSGADMLAVATMDEARSIRALAPDLPVLLLEGVVAPEELPLVEQLGLEMVVHHPAQLKWIEAANHRPGRRVWLKLDSGMHRLGFAPCQARAVHARLRALPGVEEVVLMTHFACADQADHPLNRQQVERFDAPGCCCMAYHHCPDRPATRWA